MDQSIRVVYIDPITKQQFQVTLQSGQYLKVLGQIKLPNHFYSSGWMDRVWGVDWSSLPPLEESKLLTLIRFDDD